MDNETLLEKYDPAEFYDEYIHEFIEKNVPLDVLIKTRDAYDQAVAHGDEDRCFEFYLSEYGFVNGTTVMSFGDFSDYEFPKLAEECERKEQIHMASIKEHVTVLVSKEDAEFMLTTSEMTGDEIYDKYGLHRNEDLTISAKFSDGCEAVIKHCIGEDDETPFIISTLYDQNDDPITRDDGFNGAAALGEWEFATFDENENEILYKVSVLDVSTLTREQKEDIIQQGDAHNLWLLAKDDDPQIRALVATKKDPNCLELLAKDPDPEVRMEVAYQGFKPDVMMYDSDERVRKAVAVVAKIDKDYDTLHSIAKYEKDMFIREDVGKFLRENPEPSKAQKAQDIDR